MIRKAFIFLTIVFLQFSCIPEGLEDGAFVGIGIDIGNLSDKEYENLKLHIGGLKDDMFVSTDFFELPTIIIRPSDGFSQVVTFDESRWKTDLNKIFEISTNAYFALEFEDDEIILVKNSLEGNSLLSFSVVNKKNNIKEKYGGSFILAIRDDRLISGDFFEDTMFR